jgi:CrcB protein
MKYLWIASFGILGVFARYFLGVCFAKLLGQQIFPLATFVINIVGAFFIGVVYAIGLQRALIPQDLCIGLMVGFLGGFTTFSSYCLEIVRLIESTKYLAAGFYMTASPILGTLATVVGIAIARRF